MSRLAARGSRTGAPSERGAGTVLVLALIAVVAFAGLVLAALGQAEAARGHAQASADLAALAGASAGRWGWDACGTARSAAARNEVKVVSCAEEPGGVVHISVTCPTPLGGLFGGVARASARAGPTTARE